MIISVIIMEFQTNVPKSILSKLDAKLHKKQGHPIKIIKKLHI